MQESPTKKKKLGFTDYEIKFKLGRGAYGEVFEAVRKDNQKKCALKQIQKRLLGREHKEYQALVERELLSKIEHPGVIKI
jgi:serine/threonine protein kinase